MAFFPAVKFAVLLITLVSPLHAELLAVFQTSLGNVEVALQYDKTPQTVANFITMAEATRTHIHPVSGAVIRSPLYIGEKFFRVINDTGFKIAQTGSGTGTNSGGPGFTFRDEFHASLTHVPYVLSMANSGPNSNGSQIFFTGNVSIPSLDNVHTVFGLITDPASRTVIDAILAAGNDGSTITGVTFSRTDAAAIAFNEHAQKLPVCSGVAGHLEVALGVETQYVLDSPLPPGSIIQGFRSPDLRTWAKLGEIHQGTGLSGPDTITFDGAALPRAFYQSPLISYPDALAPASLANRILVMGLFGNQTMTYQFNAAGTTGTATYSDDPTNPTPITGVTYTPSPHNATWIIYTTAYNPLRFQGALNTENPSQILGTNKSEQWNGFFWAAVSSGTLSLTK
jgi:peptidyl-prolyl cis-trans isomerase A (cyclophilin A)